MTNVRQVRQIYRPLIERHPYLRETISRFLCKTPVHHIACRIFVERTRDSDYCYPMWTVSNLFRPVSCIDMIIGTYSEYLEKPARLDKLCWRWSDPTMVADAIDVIETVALPKLAFYGTPEGYANLPERHDWVRYEAREDRMLVHIAVGDFEAARAIWTEREPLYRGETYHPDSLMHRWQNQLAAVAEPLFAEDRPALARILRGWEEANVRGTKIERYWEPAPFPFERLDG